MCRCYILVLLPVCHPNGLTDVSPLVSLLLQRSRGGAGGGVAGSNQGKPADEGVSLGLEAHRGHPRFACFHQSLSCLASSGCGWEHLSHPPSTSQVWIPPLLLWPKPCAPEKVCVQIWLGPPKRLHRWKAQAWAGFLLLKLLEVSLFIHMSFDCRPASVNMLTHSTTFNMTAGVYFKVKTNVKLHHVRKIHNWAFDLSSKQFTQHVKWEK